MQRVTRVLTCFFGVATVLTGRGSPAQTGYRQVDAQLMRRYRDAGSFYDKAKITFDKKDFEGTQGLLQAALARMPEFADAHLLMAKILYLQKDYPQALVEVELARSGHEATIDLIRTMQQDRLSALRQRRNAKDETIRLLQGQMSQVGEDRQRALLDQISRAETERTELDRELNEPFPAADQLPAEYLFIHGNILLRLQRYEEAVAQYEEALEIDPAHANAANNLASLYLSTRRPDQAAAVLARAEAGGVMVNPELKKAVAASPEPGSPATSAPAEEEKAAPEVSLPILAVADQPNVPKESSAPPAIETAGADLNVASSAGHGPAAVPPDDLRLAYLDALARITKGESAAAEKAIAEVEMAALRDGRPDSQRQLQAAEMAVAHALTRREGDAILALLQLHVRLAGTYGSARTAQAQAHAWSLIGELAALAARSSGEGVRPRAADAMACLAGYSLRAGADAAGERQYQIALLLDATNAAALEGLAAGLEWAGRYREAERLLERLAARRPDSQELWLRLAVTRQRLGGDTRVETLLRACVAPGAPAWIRAVAWQELARPHVEAEDWAAAARLLGEAAKALPNDREIATLQAYVLDRSRHRTQARAIAERLATHATGTASARFTYAQRPRTEFDRGCETLAPHLAGPPMAALQRAVAAAQNEGDR